MLAKGPVLGLDFGTRRIGLAVSDAERRIAFPAGCLERTTREKDREALAALIADRGITEIVVGLPLHMDGRPGKMAEAARTFANDLADWSGRPVELLDERWTTREAERGLRESGPRPSRRKRSGDIDAAAAALLLDTFLSRQRAAAGPGQ